MLVEPISMMTTGNPTHDTKLRPQGCVDICRACRYRDVSDAEEIAQKQAWLRKRLSQWQDVLAPIRWLAPRWGGRDKVTLKAHWQEGRWQFGLVQREEFLAIPECPLHTPRINQLMALLAQLPEALPLSHVSVVGAQLTFILRSKKEHFPHGDALLMNFICTHRTRMTELGIEGSWINWNPVVGRWLTLHKNWQHLEGATFSVHPTGEAYGPGGFGQVHWPLYMQAHAAVEQFLIEPVPAAYLELYCGLGVGLRRWSSLVSHVLGVELSGESLAMVARNAPSAQTLRGTCQQRVPQIDQWYRARAAEGAVAIFVNPPRLGLEEGVCEWLINTRPERVAYMSCSVNTLQRDLQLMSEASFEIVQLIPFDFFPKTRHIEILALLKRR